MKAVLMILALSLLTSSSFAKIISTDDKFFITTKDGQIPLSSVNDMLKSKTISKIKLYGDGSAHIISFAKKKGPMKLYSVDEKGFIYSIKPFSEYSVTKVDENGKFSFQEDPKRKYTVSPKGFFFY